MAKKCKLCQKDVATKATKCPYCQTEQRNWLSSHPIMTGICALILVLGLLGIVHIVSKNADSSNQASSEQSQPTPSIVRHDNSGAGADTGNNSVIQEHMQHALQHFG